MPDRPRYELTTDGIRITVSPDYLDEESVPSDDHFVWAYTVRVENQSDRIVTLRGRCWEITDATGHSITVSGDSVSGEQPTLRPGDAFEYTSSCPLTTPSGMMIGSYSMQTDNGDEFEVPIPPFSLDSPYSWQRPN